MELLIIIGIILVAVVYSVVATFIFIDSLFVSSMGRAFGWPAPGVFGCLMGALLWPILIPLGFALTVWDEWRYKDE